MNGTSCVIVVLELLSRRQCNDMNLSASGSQEPWQHSTPAHAFVYRNIAHPCTACVLPISNGKVGKPSICVTRRCRLVGLGSLRNCPNSIVVGRD